MFSTNWPGSASPSRRRRKVGSTERRLCAALAHSCRRYRAGVIVRDDGPDAFFAATAEQARKVLDAEDGWPTYDAGIAFQGLAMSIMSADAPARYPDEEPMALYL